MLAKAHKSNIYTIIANLRLIEMSIHFLTRRQILQSCFVVMASALRPLRSIAYLQPPDITIGVELPSDRTRAGRLSVVNRDGHRIAGPWVVLGKADGTTAARNNNNTRSTVLPYGDTPTGTYKVTGGFKVGDGTSYNKKSYGIHGALRLDPTSGDAKTAKEFGRTGLLIHSGDPGAQGKLRPTNGCLRLSNEDMKALLEELVLVSVFQGAITATCSVTTVTVQVTDPSAAPDEGYDEGDPPPIDPAAPKIP
jgi:hypothetical protein